MNHITPSAINELNWVQTLISSIGFGSIGKVQVFDKLGTYGTVSEVTVVRQREFDPHYLSAFLRAIAGQLQIERFITGATGQLHLYPRDVEKIFVPAISDHIQSEFSRLAEQGRQDRGRAQDLLDCAKHAVEIAVETGEETAHAYLDANVRKV